MATEKTLKARVKMKHGKESEWALATKFTPLIGEIIVYDVDNNHTSPRFKVGDGLTNVNNLKFVNQDELAKITTLGDELLAVKNGYLPLSGGTVTGTLQVNGDLINKQVIYCMSNNYPQLVFRNADNSKNIASLTSGSTGDYANLSIYVNSTNDNAAEFIFAKDGQFTAPNDINTEGGLYAKGGIFSTTNAYPGLKIRDASYKQLALLQSNTNDGGYSDFVIGVASGEDAWSYFTFKTDGIFGAPSDIISNGGILKSSKDRRPCIALTNASNNWLTSLAVETTDGSYGHAQLTVYKSTTEAYTFTFSNQGSFRASSTVYSSLFAVQSNNNPQLMLQNKNGAPLGMLYMETVTGAYSSAKLRVYSSASAYSTFNFGNDGKLSCGSLALTTALPISSGGTGAITAEGARTSLGITSAIGEAVDSISVGGRNLLRGTNQGAVNWSWSMQTGGKTIEEYLDGGVQACKMTRDAVEQTGWSVIGYNMGANDYALLEPNTEYTLSFDYKSSVATTNGVAFSIRRGDGSNAATNDGGYWKKIPANEWTHISGTFTTVENIPGFLTSSTEIYITRLPTTANSVHIFKNLKLEKGNKSTDWSPAPEDYLPLTGGTLTGTLTAKALYASDGNVVGSHLVTQTNNYPEVYFKNATGATLADLWVDTTTGSYAPVILRVHADASTSKDFTFGKDGVLSIPNSFSTMMGEIKNTAWPQLFFRNGDGNNLAQLVIPTNDGSYNGLAVNVFSDASTLVQYTFNSDGTFKAPFAVQAARTYVRTNNYPEHIFQNANGVTLAELYANTTTGAYAPIILRVKQSVDGFSEFTFGRDGTFTAPAGIATTGNYISIKNNSYPQLTFSNASGADIGKFFVSTTNGSYAATKIRAYSSASSYYDFQFLGTGSFSCKTINADGIDIGADSLVQLSQNDNKGSGCISIGNINLGDWRVISVADDGRLLIDYTNPIYALGSSVIYSSSQPSSPSKGMIWLKPV